ncbi:MAG: ATP phosphoribosyltransferase regulatory subunit [Thiotrichaceae bacterium]|nr:ATP phosphoribosyltransferase regulatory subunit [Thiotrichaceae bacterium]
MTDNRYWLLPEGIAEALPQRAKQLEALRRQLLDLYTSWGYDLVMPPLVEFMESLSTGTGEELDTQTFKLTDQVSGRLIGVRADMTPQVARIDAHRLSHGQVNRLCYLGPVLRARANHATGGSRSPLQVGAELFGHSGVESDCEVIAMALETLQACTAEKVTVDIGHIGIFNLLIEKIGLNKDQTVLLSDMLIRKSVPEIEQWLADADFDDSYKKLISSLPTLNGASSLLDDNRQLFTAVSADLVEIIQYIKSLISRIERCFPDVEITIDLGEIRGYAYHTGMIFQVYVPSIKREVLRGGRYDGIGKAFGHARSATGFSADLRLLHSLLDQDKTETESRIFAPVTIDRDLDKVVADLRKQGHSVIKGLDSQHTAKQHSCDQQIEFSNKQWVVNPI